MSNEKIRRLLNEHLIEGLRLPNDDLKYPVLIEGVQDISLTDTHIVAYLLPAPVYNGTLSGDHREFTGIYQMTIKVSNDIEGSNTVSDMNYVIGEVEETLQEVFPINARIGDESVFVVQVLTSISVTQATCEKNGSWWQAHAYFTYRADTN